MANSYAARYYKTPTRKTGEQLRAERLVREQYRRDEAVERAQKIKQAEEERNNAGFFKRALTTVGDFVGNVGQGLGQGLEGLVDIGAGAVGAIGGAFDPNFRDNVQNFIKKEHVADSYGKWLTSVTNDSYLNDNETAAKLVRGVAQGAGQMLPSIALNFIPGVGTALSTAAFMASAAGNATQDAYNNGADYYNGLGYGVASGVVEGAIEKLSGGIGGTKMGTVLGKQMGKSALGKAAITFAGEGLEEVASDIINPALKGVAGVKPWEDVGKEYAELPQQLPMTFAVGGLTGLAMGGAGKVANAARQGGFNQADITEMSAKKQEYNSAVDKMQASGTLTDDGIDNYINTINQTTASQAEKIAKLDVAKQTEYVNKYGAPSGFTMTENGLTRNNIQEDVTRLAGLKQAVKNGTMSASLLTSQDNLKYNPIPVASSLAQQKAIKTVNMLAERGKGLKTVLTLDLPNGENARYENGVSYINARLTQDEMSKQAVIHEYTHSLEGTKQYANFADSLIKQMQATDPNFTAVASEITSKYYDETKSQETNNYIAQTELVSHYTSQLFTEESSIKKIANADKGIATKVWEWIKNKIALLKAKKGGEEKYVTLRFLQRAENLYSQAIKTSRGGFDVSLIDKTVKENDTTTTNTEIRFSKKLSKVEMKKLVSDIMEMKPITLQAGEKTITAEFDKFTAGKNIYTQGKSSLLGFEYKLENIKELPSVIQGASYSYSASELGKKIPAHSGVKEWHYFINQITANNGRIFDIVINIRDKGNSQYVYEVAYKQKKSPTNTTSNGREDVHQNKLITSKVDNSTNSIRDKTENVNRLDENNSKKDENIRYSLAIGNENVTVEAEKTKNLVAIHNLSEENLLNVLELGGFPMPSIAVIKVDGEHSNYGNISVVFRPDAVNPQANANNKIYSADAYTPKFPQTEYSLNYKEFKALAEKLKTSMSSLEVSVFKGGDKERMISKLSSNREARELFVKESGLKVVPVLHDPKYSSNSAFEKDAKIAKLNAEKVEDDYSYSDGLNNLIAEHRQEFDVFVEDLITPVLGKKWLRNNEQYYTDNGNSRSFESLHEEYTAENAMKIMNSMGSKNAEGGIFGYGVGEIRAALSKTYNSFDTLHKDESKIQTIQDELTSEQYEKCTKKLSDICSEIAELIKTDNYFQASDIASSAVLDIISKTSTNSSAKAYVKREYTINISDDIINSVRELGKEIEKLPVEYFEAKPKRVIDFSEIQNVLLPASVSQNITSKLQDKNIPYQIYDDTQENSRSQIIKTMDNVRFSKTLDSAIIKTRANVTRAKVYSKKEIGEAVNSILEDVLSNENYQAALKGAKKQSVIDGLFDSFNTATGEERNVIASDMARYLIEETALEDIYKADIREQTVENSTKIIDAIRGYVGALDLGNIKGELEHAYDVLGARGVMLAWNKKGGIGADVAAQELENSGITIKATNEADAFIEIKQLYDNAKNALKKEADNTIKEIYTQEEIGALRQELTQSILNVANNYGKDSWRAKVKNRIDKMKQEIKIGKARNRVTNSILDSARKAAEIAKNTGYTSAEVFNDPALKGMIKLVASFKSRSDIANGSMRGARQQAEKLSKIYNKENQLLYSEDSSLNMLDENVVSAIQLLAGNANLKTKKGGIPKFSLEELQAIDIIAKGILHLHKTYDNIFVDGKLKSLTDIAARGVTQGEMRARLQRKSGFFGNVGTWLNKLIRNIADPTAIMRNLDGYATDGVLTETVNAVKDGETKAGVALIDLADPFESFFAEHKGFLKHLDDKITVANKTFTVNQAMALCKTSEREQAHLFEASVWVETKSGDIKYKVTPEDIAELYSKFTAEDEQYIALAQDMFNNKAKKLKMETDLELIGYTNVEDGNNYIPISRDKSQIAQNLTDKIGIVNEVAAANNMSFNKSTKTNAKNDLYINGLSNIIDKHIKGISMYYGLAVPLKNLNRVYNKAVVNNDTGVKTSMREIITHYTAAGTADYITKLCNDIQGVGKTKTQADKILSYMRAAYAKFQLGLNPKTVLSQLSSYPMAFIYLDASSLAKGAGMKTNKEAMFKYCPQAKFRMKDKSIVKAQGALDKVGKVGDIATKPIQLMDNLTIDKLWNACQAQSQKDGNGEIGSEQNLTSAGKLLNTVIRDTQSNSITSERSGMSRSNNFLVSSFTMFMSDATKQFSRLYDAVGEINMLRFKIKNGDSTAETLKQYKTAKTRLRRTVSAVVTSNLVYVMIGMFFKFLYDKDRKDKNGNEIGFAQDFTQDFAGSIMGMIPIVRDIYGMLSNDFEINNYALGMINDLIKSTQGISEVVTSFVQGREMTTTQLLKPIRDMLYAIGQATGIPIRNVYNMAYGIIKRFFPELAYKANSLFYNNNSYKADMQKAVDDGKSKMAKTVAIAELEKRGIKYYNVKEELSRIMLSGETTTKDGKETLAVLGAPIKQIGDKITIDKEEFELTPKQQKSIKAEYLKVDSQISKLIQTTDYIKLPAQLKPKAIQFLSDLYYILAIKAVLGKGTLTNNQLATKTIPSEKLAVYLSAITAITADKDKQGNTIANPRKSKVYKYVNSLNISTQQQLTLMQLAGYTVAKKK